MADSEAQKYSSPPPSIDFAAAKTKIKDTELVDLLESFYNSNKPAPETFEWPEDDKQHTENHLAFMRDQAAFDAEALPVLEKEVEYLKETRTTEETTVYDMYLKYPSLHEEIEDEIEEREWFKDTGLESSSK